MSIQFATLASLHSYHVGLLRERLRGRYPNISEQGALPPVFETFGGRQSQEAPFRFETFLSPPMPRFWFESESGPLMQVQQDRLMHNWRKLEDSQSYPRYENVRGEFEEDIRVFRDFLKDLELGDIQPNQAEIAYINTIQLPEDIETPAYLHSVLSNWTEPNVTAGAFEGAIIQSRFVLKRDNEPYARMHINIQPAIRVSNQASCVRMEITVRGKPTSATVEASFDFFDRGRDAIVKSFADMTTPEMHAVWGRTK